MSRIFIKNTTRQDITLNVRGADPVTIPAAVDGPAGFAPGTASADDSFVAEAKKSEVVAFYFEAGWLEVMKSPKSSKTEQTPE
jgi:hypothetical protein